MIKVKLTPEEKRIMSAIERDEYVPVLGAQLKEIAGAIAARRKDATLTLRVNGGDIHRIRKMAEKRGIPYQAYIAEVIHRIAQAI